MQKNLDKRDRADQFRTRLAAAMAQNATSQSALARAIGVDRSTISQLLSGDTPRLPNAQVVGAAASYLGVSADWLLGLTEHSESAADLLATSLSMTEAPRALVDETIFAWHQEAAGYKIRHVPASLPDLLKTREMLRWEYAPQLGRTAEQAIGASEDRLNWMRGAQSDYEIALPLHELQSFAQATGYYTSLSQDIRVDQIARIADLHDQFYPSMRIYLFDARRVFSSPITIFGPLLSVLYLGRHYVAFRDRERVSRFTQHFDWLVREAAITPRELPEHLNGLRQTAMQA